MTRRPPRDITPSDFFTNWLPAQFLELARTVQEPLPEIMVNVEITGDGGGQWTLDLRAGALTVKEGLAPDAPLCFMQSVKDWSAVTTGEAEKAFGIELPDESFASLDKLLVHPGLGRMASPDTMKGCLELAITHQGEPGIGAKLMVHGAREPKAHIAIDSTALVEIQGGKINPAEAFFGGKIQVTGDQSLAMQLGLMLMGPS